MKKQVIWGAALSAALMTAALASFGPGQSHASSGGQVLVSQNTYQPPTDFQLGQVLPSAAPEQTVLDQSGAQEKLDWSIYEPYGLRYDEDTDQLTYQGQRVRWFEDLWPVTDETDCKIFAGIDHLDEQGTMDVRANRDLTKRISPDGSYDPSGVLLGLEPFSQEEFDARDLTPLKNQGVTAMEGEPLSPEESAALYAPYEPFGLTYDKNEDCLYFQGKRVRYFLDILSTNGKPLEGGEFKGSMRSSCREDGVIDVYTLRDYDRPDQEGFGALLAVKANTQEEFDARTAAWNAPGGGQMIQAQ